MSITERNIALRRLRSEHAGLLLVDERLDPVRFIIDGATGDPIMPVPGDALELESVTLYAPDDTSGSVQILGSAIAIDPTRHEGADRFIAYFAKPSYPRWARLEIESLRLDAIVLDSADVRTPNPLYGPVESALCKLLNLDLVRLGRLCEREIGTAPANPLCVGVDSFGIDVRARFGIVRLEFPAMVTTPEAARAIVEDMLNRVKE